MCIFIAGNHLFPQCGPVYLRTEVDVCSCAFNQPRALSINYVFCSIVWLSVYKICLKQGLSSRAVTIPDSLYFPITKKKIIKSACKYFISYFSGIIGKCKVTMKFESLVFSFFFKGKFLSSEEDYITAYTDRKNECLFSNFSAHTKTSVESLNQIKGSTNLSFRFRQGIEP